jgi:hypothetical protein
MSWKRTMTNMVVPKLLDTAITFTAGATVQGLSTAFVVGTDKKYSSVKAMFTGVKAGSAAVDVQIELQSDTDTGNAYRSLTNTDGVAITAVGTDNAHGHVATTGNLLVAADFDLNQVKVGANLKIRVTCTFTAGSVDTVIGHMILLLAGARKEPPTSALISTVA